MFSFKYILIILGLSVGAGAAIEYGNFSVKGNLAVTGTTTNNNTTIIANEKTIQFREATGSGTNYVALKAPTTLSTDYTMVLPTTVGFAGQALITDGSGTLSWGEAGGGGELNYISNDDAEIDTSGWTTYADSGSRPVDGTGGSPVSTWTRSTTSPLRGVASFLWSKTGSANRQGEGVCNAITIDDASKAKVLKIEFDYGVVSGTFVAGTSTADSDLIAYMIDVTNNVVIEPSTFKLFSSAVAPPSEQFQASFQTSSNSTSYKFCIHTATVSTANYVVKFDNFKVTPSKYIYGTPITDYQSYTPTITGFGTASSVDFFWRRVGDSIKVIGKFTSGTSTGVTASITLPNGLTVDTTKVSSIRSLGKYINQGTAISNKGGATLGSPTSNLITFGAVQTFGAGSTSATLTSQLGNAIASSGDVFSIEFEAPINGQSSSVQMSDNASQRVVVLSNLNTSVTGTISGTASTAVYQVSPTNFSDTHSGYNSSTGEYTVKVSGFYRYTSYTYLTLSGTLSNSGGVIQKNGTNVIQGDNVVPGTGTTSQVIHVSGVIWCNVGDTLRTQIFSNTTTKSYATDLSSLSIERISGPNAIGATENVNISVSSSAGQSLSGSDATNVLQFATEAYDTHGAWDTSTHRFTTPIAGKYRITSFELLTSASWTAGNRFYVYARKNGSTTVCSLGFLWVQASVSLEVSTQGSCELQLVAGDYLEVIGIHSNGSSKTRNSVSVLPSLQISKIGM